MLGRIFNIDLLSEIMHLIEVSEMLFIEGIAIGEHKPVIP